MTLNAASVSLRFSACSGLFWMLKVIDHLYWTINLYWTSCMSLRWLADVSIAANRTKSLLCLYITDKTGVFLWFIRIKLLIKTGEHVVLWKQLICNKNSKPALCELLLPNLKPKPGDNLTLYMKYSFLKKKEIFLHWRYRNSVSHVNNISCRTYIVQIRQKSINQSADQQINCFLLNFIWLQLLKYKDLSLFSVLYDCKSNIFTQNKQIFIEITISWLINWKNKQQISQ